MMAPERGPNEFPSELLEQLGTIEDDMLRALTAILEESPELLEETLEEYGYFDEEQYDSVTANERPDQQRSAETELGRRLEESMGNPRTAEQIVDLLEEEHSDYLEEHKSARHRSWVNTKLGDLVKSGEIGRFPDGRSVFYTRTVEEAIRHWALRNNRFVEDLSVADTTTIADDTGMEKRDVRVALKRLVGEGEDYE